MMENKALMYNSIPTGLPVAGQDISIKDIGFDDQAPPPKGGVTTHNIYATFDPSQRGRMRDLSIKSYSAPMQPGSPVLAVQVFGKVVKSDTSKFQPGDIIELWSARIETYSSVDEETINDGRTTKLQPEKGVPLAAYAGALGMPGMTAYGSFKEIGKPKKGDVVLISAAAGGVGQLVGQFALRQGCHVIGSVGDDRKLEFITKELGFHSGFNYKKEDMREAIQRLAPDGLDIYFDNVGGPLLDAVFTQMKYLGRIIACGAISGYSKTPEGRYGIKNYSNIITKSLTMRGFIQGDKDIQQWRQERDTNVTKWIQDGSLKLKDHVTVGIENGCEGFLDMLEGRNLGRSLLKISDE